MTFLAIAPLLAGGIGLVFWLWPDTPGNKARDIPLKLVLGCLIGLGVGSCIDFFWKLVCGSPGVYQLSLETLLAAAAIWAAVRRKPWKGWNFNLPVKIKWIEAFAVTIWLILTGVLLVIFIQRTLLSPYGTFDAFAIWNLRARFMYILGTDWRQAFNPLLNWKFHTDYPLLLPLNVLRIWELLGYTSLRGPMVLAVLFTGGLVCLLFSGLSATRGFSQGALAGCILAGTPWLLSISTAETADIPLTGYMLSAAVLFWLNQVREDAIRDRFSVLAGLCAGLAAWTKNEGMLFFLVMFLIVTLSAWQKRSWSKLGAFLLGGAFPLLILVTFKIWLATPGDLFAGQTLADILAKLVNGTRYVAILHEIYLTFADAGGWGFPFVLVLIGFVLLSWKKPSNLPNWSITLLLPALTLAGYAGIYLVTPHDLVWHLQYSADRLLFQVYPLFLFILFQATFSPAEAAAALASMFKKSS